MNAIETKGLCKSFGDFQLKDIELTLPTGCIMGLVGKNGAGKSTTIKLIMDALERDSGSVKVLGTDNKAKEFIETKEDIGIVLDEAYFPEVLTAKNINLVLRNTYKHWDEKQFFSYLSRFSLPDNKQFRDFSRGMKMKLAIAVALSHSPKLLILDEATSGLDPVVRDEILDIFNEFTRDPGHSVLLSSHIVSDLEKICDYIAFINNGRLQLCEEKDRLMERFGIIRCGKEELEAIPEAAVRGVKQGKYGNEVLVERQRVADCFNVEHASLEDIILFMVREDKG